MKQFSKTQSSKPWFQTLVEIPDGYFYAFMIACWFIFVVLIISNQFGGGSRGLGGISFSASSVTDSDAALSSNISRFEESIVTVGCDFGLSQPTLNFKAGRPSGQIGFICRFSAARYRDLLPSLETSAATLTLVRRKRGNSDPKGHRVWREDDACNVGGHDRDFIQRVTAGRDRHPFWSGLHTHRYQIVNPPTRKTWMSPCGDQCANFKVACLSKGHVGNVATAVREHAVIAPLLRNNSLTKQYGCYQGTQGMCHHLAGYSHLESRSASNWKAQADRATPTLKAKSQNR